MWEGLSARLDALAVDDNLSFIETRPVRDVVAHPLEENTKVCTEEIDLIKTIFSRAEEKPFENISVLEIGAGYGNFCKVFHEVVGSPDYTIVDIPSMLRLSKKFLEVNKIDCNFVEISNYEALFGKGFDILISNVCMSEMPRRFLKDFLIDILPYCKRVSIIDSSSHEFFEDVVTLLDSYFRIYVMPCVQCKQTAHNIFFSNQKRTQ
jgi:hypothetical protein